MSSIARRLSRRGFLIASGAMGLAVAADGWPRSAIAGDSKGRGETVRVLLRQPGGALDASSVTLSGESKVAVRDLTSDALVGHADANARVSVGRDGESMWVQIGDEKRRSGIGGPIRLDTDGAALLRNLSTGTERAPTYRGAFEIRGLGEGRVGLMNVLGLEDYLAGVVPSEMPDSFGLEAVRAQAIAARGYALARRSNSAHRDVVADLCDAVDCQTYGGAGAERKLSREALASTRGLVVLRGGVPITSMYSSTCGGHTDAMAGSGNTVMALFGATVPRDGVPDGQLPHKLDLTTDDGAATFFRGSWESHCASSARYRWTVSWERKVLEEVLTAGLRRLAGVSLVAPRVSETDSVGTLTGLAVTSRGISGRARSIKISGSGGEWTIERDWPIRNLLRDQSGQPLPSTAFAVELEKSSDRKPSRVTLFGAGWGHGIGLCQWGARGLAAKGNSAEQILGHYYPGSTIGPHPSL